MNTKQIIIKLKKQLAQIQTDPRYKQPLASVEINAILALIQTGMYSEIKILEKVINMLETSTD